MKNVHLHNHGSRPVPGPRRAVDDVVGAQPGVVVSHGVQGHPGLGVRCSVGVAALAVVSAVENLEQLINRWHNICSSLDFLDK